MDKIKMNKITLNHERFSTYEGALRTYKHETGNVVYDRETYERFGRWLYAPACKDTCPFYRIVEGEGSCSPRCTNPTGHCRIDEKERLAERFDVDHVLKIGRRFQNEDTWRGAHWDTTGLLCDTIETLQARIHELENESICG